MFGRSAEAVFSRWAISTSLIFSSAKAPSISRISSSMLIISIRRGLTPNILALITTKFYKFLALITKLCIAPKGSKQLLPDQKFQKLAGITCRKLTSSLYNFVALMQ
ncbi:hypothetical protein J5N97_006441 [Dioscorea zingiberensis]|uniref:FANCI solenoid 4 domain-containing protein n=1 Tax=Dioscorea zingiberensis TaxID=325984 RepID=A0A9D5D9X6_9LILI|nr:hypothetical protein J5N97_006441 [Dioscorea zingiberensis]